MTDLAPAQLQITPDGGHDGECRLRVAGELDMAVAGQLEAAARLHRGAATELVLDFSAVTFMDSTGLGLLVSLNSEASNDGWNLTVIASPAVWRIVELCDLQRMLNVRPASPRAGRRA